MFATRGPPWRPTPRAHTEILSSYLQPTAPVDSGALNAGKSWCGWVQLVSSARRRWSTVQMQLREIGKLVVYLRKLPQASYHCGNFSDTSGFNIQVDGITTNQSTLGGGGGAARARDCLPCVAVNARFG